MRPIGDSGEALAEGANARVQARAPGVREEARGAGHDLAGDDEVVLAQRGARGDNVAT